MFYMEIPLLSYKCKLNKDMQCDFFNVRKSHTPYLSQQTLIKPTGFSFLIVLALERTFSVIESIGLYKVVDFYSIPEDSCLGPFVHLWF